MLLVTPLCSCPNLLLKGLMTIGMIDYSPNPECFARLVQVTALLTRSCRAAYSIFFVVLLTRSCRAAYSILSC
jgi:uncharacterized pyridoxal phosphate-containing UPF0001 family protein